VTSSPAPVGRQASPLVRSRTRDYVVVTGVDCSCGRTGCRVRCVGRTDDMLVVRGINVFPSALKDTVLGFGPAANGEMRVRANFAGQWTQRPLNVVVEYSKELGVQREDDLRAAIEERIRPG
jgi:phenylacetate-CoA ligase